MSTVLRPERHVWRAAGALVTVAALGFGVPQLATMLAHAEERSTLTFTEAVRAVDVRTSGGRVRVVPAGSVVTVERRISHGIRDTKHSERVEGGVLVVRASCPAFNSFCGAEYTLHVPASVAVTVDASGGGVEVVGMAGDLDLDSSGGGVRVVAPTGSVRARSSGGGVRIERATSQSVEAESSGGGVTVTFVVPPGQVRASSSGGGVTVEVPPGGTAYQVDASSLGGGTDVDVPTDPLGDRRIEARSRGGSVRVHRSGG